jgi:cell division protein FtsQ
VVSRPHLALVPANGLRGRLRGWLVRALVVVGVILVGIGLAYGAARYTSLFALEQVEVTGGPASVRESVRHVGMEFAGTSLVALDEDELRTRLTALPTVHSIRIDRAYPHTLRVAVVPERPLAVLRDGWGAWLVSDRARVIGSADPKSKRPVIWTAQADLEAGENVADENARLALEALRHVPRGFPEQVETAQAADGAVTLVLGSGLELRLGGAESLALKLAAAARVLRTLSASEQHGFGYLDVSVPERVVAGQL